MNLRLCVSTKTVSLHLQGQKAVKSLYVLWVNWLCGEEDGSLCDGYW